MNLSELLIKDNEALAFEDVFLDEKQRIILDQLVKECTYFSELTDLGLPVNNKVFLHGSSGCGKTTTAKALAKRLNKTIIILDLSTIVSAKLGETSQHIKLVFEKASRERAVLFLDEFDQIGKSRAVDDKDVGEMRRIVNTLIQLIDYFSPNSVLICASNHADIIDQALMRRFQLRLNYELPSQEQLDNYYDRLISNFPSHFALFKRKYNVSYAEAKDYALTSIKKQVINQLEARDKI
ncbi:ATPase family associated with various cellular activities (AAA) [Myroides marinus]|uniref:ATPase family associated with various cellular activities (AAA) n=1 Tax=Myroides marinus TaxID=703342 RepID=A0A1H6Y840_9FLAO|nr:ATP-binding protein [Myroides marinus]SEJ37401.1 ATPase family associated with various cellular activities (AAA) [Myroides marinus]